jgi:ribosomal protein S18 acetylase RimI-like enzyme
MTRLDHRGKGIGAQLVRAAEKLAIDNGRMLLVLDTATEDGAAGLYEKLGFTLTGEIPDYALKPHGGLTGTLIYWKRIGAAAA